MHLPRETGYKILELGLQRLLEIIEEEPRPRVLWNLRYSRQELDAQDATGKLVRVKTPASNRVLILPDLASGLAFDDSILEHVRLAWQKITGLSDGFMHFEGREQDAFNNEDDDY